MKPSTIASVHNQDDLNIFVSLGQANRVVVVESRSLVIERADNNRLVYSIREAAPAVVAPEPEPLNPLKASYRHRPNS